MGGAAAKPDFTIELFIAEHPWLAAERDLERVWERHQAYVTRVCQAHGQARQRAYLLRCCSAYAGLGREDAHALRRNTQRLIARSAEARRRARGMGLP